MKDKSAKGRTAKGKTCKRVKKKKGRKGGGDIIAKGRRQYEVEPPRSQCSFVPLDESVRVYTYIA